MAERLDSFPGRGPSVGAAQRYPWDEWFDGSVWKLKQGEDFPGDIEGFRGTLYKKAQMRGHKARVALLKDENAIVIQAVKD